MNAIWGLDNLDNELTGELILVVPGVFKSLEYKSCPWITISTSPRLCMSLACFRMVGRAPYLLRRLPRCHQRGLCSVCKQCRPPTSLDGKSANLSTLSWRCIMGGGQTMDCWQLSLLWKKMCLVSGTNKLKSKAIIPIGNNHTCAKHAYNVLSISVSYWFYNTYCSTLIFLMLYNVLGNTKLKSSIISQLGQSPLTNLMQFLTKRMCLTLCNFTFCKFHLIYH